MFEFELCSLLYEKKKKTKKNVSIKCMVNFVTNIVPLGFPHMRMEARRVEWIMIV